jgi:uncharacterized protein YukE
MTFPGLPPAATPAPDWRSSLSSAVNNVNLQVTSENVLDVRKILLQEADRLQKYGGQDAVMTQLVGLCGGDPVSQQAAQAFNQRIRQEIQRCQDYARELRNAGNSLDQVAKNYGYTEEQIEDSFKSINPGAQA